MEGNCRGEHHYFVAEVIANEAEGKVFVLTICTACDDFHVHEAVVGQTGASLRLLQEEKKKG